MKSKTLEPEFSRTFSVDKIPSGGTEQDLTANERERHNLVKRFSLLELPKLAAHLKIRSSHAGQAVEVTGNLTADVVQQCVVTLEPLPAHIQVHIDTHYIPAEKLEGRTSLIGLDEDNVETLIDGTMDLGELVAQHLGAALDPYPRKPGVKPIEAEYGDVTSPSATISPFAKLADIKKKDKQGD